MATETSRGLSDHARGITVTTLACLAGVAAALVSAELVGTSADAATDGLALSVMAAFVVLQYPVLYVLGIDVGDFGIKDNLYVAFMTFALWFITFAVLLSSGAAL